jgi:DNA topoisomerase-1
VDRVGGQGGRRPSPRPLLTKRGTPAPPADRVARRDARASGLRYVSVDSPGIHRRKAGRGFSYVDDAGRRVRDPKTLDRIRRIAIPPAWTDVWICASPEGHIQAVGRDARGRRQYRYHPEFRGRRDAGKFARLIRFGERLPRIRRRVRHDLGLRGLPRDKVLAAVVRLLELTRLRVGNAEYATLNRTFGLTTLRDRHAVVRGATIRFRFRGKGGQTEERSLIDRRLAGVVRRCQELPGQELFQYEDDAGEVRAVASDDVNAYLRDAAGDEAFSAKDFRTWTATVHAFRELQATAAAEPPRRRQSQIVHALRRTAEELGNTLAVTRGSYVHPDVVAAFEEAPGVDAGADAAPSRRRTLMDRPPSRDDELALLALLRRASSRAARRSKVRTRGAAGRQSARSA